MHPKPTVALGAVLLSTLSIPITLTGASVALPSIATDLEAGLAATQWVVNGQIATFASFMLATGSLADMIGRRRVFASGVALFAAAGVLSAVAWDIVLLDVLRVLAGVGAAAAASSAAAILAATFEGRARIRAFGMFGTTLGIGLSFGPTIAGLLLEWLGWRAVFGAPAVAGLVAFCLVPMLSESRAPGSRRVDWAGTASFTLSLLLLVFTFVEGPELGWSSAVVVGGFLASAALLAVFVVVERHQTQPMFDFGLLANPRFIGLSLAAAVLVSVPVPLVVYLPSYFTNVSGMSTGAAGATLLLLTGLLLVLPMLGSVITKWITPAAVVVLSVALVGIGAAWLTVLEPDTSVAAIAGPLLTIGLGFGVSTGLVDGVAIGSVPPDHAGTGAGMFNTVRLAIETVAIAVTGAVLAGSTGGRLAEPGFTSGLHTVLWLMGGISVLLAIVLARPLLRKGFLAKEMAVAA
ncbi:MFS transporter [Kibdelosporangium philippinense]|uniref:MFS transporter n=1 Tax=Kibdelosporangium philippinense TaxID=211113 RepID=A0ABS8ZYD7_9PSEU|nr:MFS transporter [Kibdelosporangium philippinense]MCE7011112.1 MFS transporter [Kibdelosporangium philippinense]